MASALEGYTKNCVISFIDLYQKVRKNFPEVRAVEKEERLYLGKAMIEIAAEHGMRFAHVEKVMNWQYMEQTAADA